jgi:hypothetical protein
MASLSKAQLKKRNNLEVLRDKFFGQKGMVNMFVGPEGQFHPAALIIETSEGQSAYEPKDVKEMDAALDAISEFIESRGAKLYFTGKYANTGKITTLPLDKLEKTSEFGGQGAKSGKQNLGLVFEKDLFDSLVGYFETGKPTGKYGKQAKQIIDSQGKKVKKPLTEVVSVGELNQRRPLSISGNSLKLGNGAVDIGNTVTDITLKFNGNTEVYLSLKYGNTLAFANIGVGTVFKESEMKSGKMNAKAKTICKVFGLSEDSFSETFTNYPHSKKIENHQQDVTSTCDKNAISSLLKQMVGKGYVMVHGKGTNVEVYDINDAYWRSATTLTGKITAYYGGTTGKGKKVIVSCESAKYKFQFNFRNKQSGTFPSHIMCDYQKK